MKIKYCQDTDTLHIEFRAADVAETKDLDENTFLDLDRTAEFAPSRSSTGANAPKYPSFPTNKLPHKHQHRRLSRQSVRVAWLSPFSRP